MLKHMSRSIREQAILLAAVPSFLLATALAVAGDDSELTKLGAELERKLGHKVGE